VDNKQVILSDVAIVNSGATFPTLMQGEKEGQYPYYKVSDMNTVGNEVLMSVAVNYVDEDARKELNAKVIERGSIVFPKVGAALRTNKKRILKYDSCMDNNMMAITAMPSKVLPAYLYHLLIRTDLMRFANDANPPSMRKADLERWKISLPPLKEQQRIVEILDRAANLKGLRQQAIETTQRIAPALFYEMFGNPVRNEKGWEVATLDEISSKGQYGLNAPALKEGKGVRYIRITDIDSYGTLREDSIAYVDSDTENIDKYWLSSGDILIARSGATAGKSMIYKGGSDDAVFAGYLIRFQINKEVAVPEYVASFLQTRAYWSQLNPKIRVAAQPNVNARELGSLILPLPLLNEQRRFVDKLNELRFIQLQQSQSVAQTKQLSSALSAQLLAA